LFLEQPQAISYKGETCEIKAAIRIRKSFELNTCPLQLEAWGSLLATCYLYLVTIPVQLPKIPVRLLYITTGHLSLLLCRLPLYVYIRIKYPGPKEIPNQKKTKKPAKIQILSRKLPKKPNIVKCLCNPGGIIIL